MTTLVYKRVGFPEKTAELLEALIKQGHYATESEAVRRGIVLAAQEKGVCA